jgi:hypothetical protein
MHRLPRLLIINRYMHLETLRYILFSKKKTSPLTIFVIQRLNKKKIEICLVIAIEWQLHVGMPQFLLFRLGLII